jgi:thioredoxin reductase (NADPH)
LIGYLPDTGLLARSGVRLDPVTLVPEVNPDTCESNTPGLYLAGTLLAGRDTGKIFIENSRDHGGRIVRHLLAGKAVVPAGGRE